MMISHPAPRGSRAGGLVSLVGAGPGDPDLITVKGLRRLEAADAVVYDRLVHPDLVARAPADCRRVAVGKARGRSLVAQEDINTLLVFLGRRLRRVVRLKGGDPCLFGRGGEEASALAAAGVAFEIVPGVSSALAGPAAAGVPVTDRRFGSSVAIVTGHESPARSAVEWASLATAVDTIVVLMGIRHAGEIAQALIDGGLDDRTPVAVIEKATHREQRSIKTCLGHLGDDMRGLEVVSPAVIVIGEVVRLGRELGLCAELDRVTDPRPAPARQFVLGS